MGNEASRPATVEPPAEWDPASNAKKFELVSPMSDLSDPSMFLHRRPHPKLSNATVQQISGKKQSRGAKEPPAKLPLGSEHQKVPAVARQTPAGDRRRRSKVITRDSAYKHESRQRELAPPSAFYFPNVPTRESEENLNRLSVRKSSSTGARRQSNTTNSNDDGKDKEQQDQENKENNARKSTPLLVKAKRKVNRARSCLTGCFEESSQKIQLMKDNTKPKAKRGERLPSEAGNEKTVSLLQKVDEDPILEEAFDPYKEDPLPKAKPTVLQFIDGAEKELVFNPVWRESHDGTYHSDPSSTIGRRSSDFALAEKNSKETSRRASDPPSQAYKSCPAKMDALDTAVDKAKNGLVPHPPGDQLERFNEVQPVHSQDRESFHGKESTQPRQSIETTNSGKESTSRENSSSAAMSHESSYWNGFYTETQVLHQKDAYFDRIAFVPNKSSVPESSPMANNSTATPVVDLFGQDKPKSLLGSMDTSDVDFDEKLGPSKTILESGSFSQRSNSEVLGDSPGSFKSGKEATSIVSSSSQGAFRGKEDPGSKESPSRNSFGDSQGSASPAESDEPPLDRMSKKSEPALNENKVQKNDRDSNQSKSEAVMQPRKSEALSVENRDDGSASIHEKPSEEDAVVFVGIKNVNSEDKNSVGERNMKPSKVVADESENQKENSGPEKPPRDSFLDERITADKILVQTSLVTKMPTNPAPKRDSIDIKAALQATPQASMLEHKTSTGSAFSYKDKDVFTPVTSLTTYPKGSPFRPRVGVNEKAMAKAKLDQPIMFTQSFDNRSRSSRATEIQACETAPSMIESHDYRDIAFGCFLEDTPSTIADKKERALALFNPISMESPMSTSMSPAQPLLSHQVVNNAAFLFSPSYATGNTLLNDAPNNVSTLQQLDQTPKIGAKGRSFSISTVGSRNRLTSRSRNSIRIPFSSSGSLPPAKPKSVSGSRKSSISRSRKSSISDDGSRQKSVRFSEGQSVAESGSGSQKSRRSVTWNFSFQPAPKNVDIPAIETKVSDLSDTVFGRDPSPVASTTKRESVDSAKSATSSLRNTAIEEETASLTLSESASRHSLVSTKMSQEPSLASAAGSRHSLASTRTSQKPSRCSYSNTGTPEQTTRTWTYCELTKGVTPLLDRKELAQATNSPVLRFKAAKNKFVGTHKQEKEVKATKKSPSFCKRKTGRVHLLASKFDNGGQALDPMHVMGLKSNSHDFSYSSVQRPTTTTAEAGSVPLGERPMLRTPQILGYTNHLPPPNIYDRASLVSRYSIESQSKPPSLDFLTVSTMPTRSMSTDASVSRVGSYDEIPEEDSDDDASQQSIESDDSTFVQSVATLRQDRHTKQDRRIDGAVNIVEEDPEADRLLDEILQTQSHDSQDAGTNNGEDVPCDEAADDFAELLLNTILSAPSQDESSVQQTMKVVKSISWDDEYDDNSSFTNIHSVPTFSDESTTMSSILAKQETANLRHGAKTVKPHAQKLHQSVPSSQDLHLSPLQKTPMQASKWRELALQAQKEDNKKSIFRGKNKSKKPGLSEKMNMAY